MNRGEFHITRNLQVGSCWCWLIQSFRYIRGDISATFLAFPSYWPPNSCLVPAITSVSALEVEERGKMMPTILVSVAPKSEPRTKTWAHILYLASDSWIQKRKNGEGEREGKIKRQEDVLRSLLPWVMGAQFHLDLQRSVCNASQKCTPERKGCTCVQVH